MLRVTGWCMQRWRKRSTLKSIRPRFLCPLKEIDRCNTGVQVEGSRAVLWHFYEQSCQRVLEKHNPSLSSLLYVVFRGCGELGQTLPCMLGKGLLQTMGGRSPLSFFRKRGRTLWDKIKQTLCWLMDEQNTTDSFLEAFKLRNCNVMSIVLLLLDS